MKASIIIPTYNPDIELFNKCLSSCKSQNYTEDFEIIIMYDDTKANNRIITLSNKYGCRLIGKEHSGISDTLNLAIIEAKGEFIFLLNQTDISLPDRLETVIKFFNENPDYDMVLTSYNEINSDPKKKKLNLSFDIDFNRLIENTYSRSTICFRKESIINKLPYWFEQYYYPCDDYKFYLSCLIRKLKIKKLKNTLVEIYPSKTKETEDYKIKYKRVKSFIDHLLTNIEEPLMTVILPFKNERTEVERTINSIYATTKHTEIIVINDSSDDDINYDYLPYLYQGIKYIKNPKSIGHGNIDLGVVNAETPYCILLDAHMRMFVDDWDLKIIDVLKEKPNSIVYGKTVIMHVNENGTLYNEDFSQEIVETTGAGVKLDFETKYPFLHFWAYNNKCDDAKENVHISPNVLGACYAFSVNHYKNIGGTYGLMQYGASEACLALKTWLLGGQVYRIEDLFVGHIYRKEFPYTIKTNSSKLNLRFLTELCEDNEENKAKYLQNIISNIPNKEQFNKEWEMNYEKLKYYIDHYKSRFLIKLEDFNKDINSKFL